MTGFVMGGGGGGTSLPQLANAATAKDILEGREALDQNGQKIVGSISKKGAQTYTPGSSPQVIAAGQYLSGDQTIAAIPGYSVRVEINNAATISYNTYFRPQKIAILVDSQSAQSAMQIIACKYDEAVEGNTRAFTLNENQDWDTGSGKVRWTINDNGFSITALSGYRFNSTYYILATP